MNEEEEGEDISMDDSDDINGMDMDRNERHFRHFYTPRRSSTKKKKKLRNRISRDGNGGGNVDVDGDDGDGGLSAGTVLWSMSSSMSSSVVNESNSSNTNNENVVNGRSVVTGTTPPIASSSGSASSSSSSSSPVKFFSPKIQRRRRPQQLQRESSGREEEEGGGGVVRVRVEATTLTGTTTTTLAEQDVDVDVDSHKKKLEDDDTLTMTTPPPTTTRTTTAAASIAPPSSSKAEAKKRTPKSTTTSKLLRKYWETKNKNLNIGDGDYWDDGGDVSTPADTGGHDMNRRSISRRLLDSGAKRMIDVAANTNKHAGTSFSSSSSSSPPPQSYSSSSVAASASAASAGVGKRSPSGRSRSLLKSPPLVFSSLQEQQPRRLNLNLLLSSPPVRVTTDDDEAKIQYYSSSDPGSESEEEDDDDDDDDVVNHSSSTTTSSTPHSCHRREQNFEEEEEEVEVSVDEEGRHHQRDGEEVEPPIGHHPSAFSSTANNIIHNKISSPFERILSDNCDDDDANERTMIENDTQTVNSKNQHEKENKALGAKGKFIIPPLTPLLSSRKTRRTATESWPRSQKKEASIAANNNNNSNSTAHRRSPRVSPLAVESLKSRRQNIEQRLFELSKITSPPTTTAQKQNAAVEETSTECSAQFHHDNQKHTRLSLESLWEERYGGTNAPGTPDFQEMMTKQGNREGPSMLTDPVAEQLSKMDVGGDDDNSLPTPPKLQQVVRPTAIVAETAPTTTTSPQLGITKDGKVCRRCQKMGSFCFQHINI